MTFIDTDAGRINLRFVVCLKEARQYQGHEPRTRVTYVEGGESLNTWADLCQEDLQPTAVIAGSPGFFLLDIARDGDHEVIQTPIVAWRVVAGCAKPITPDEFFVCDDFSFRGVLTPQGTVIVAGEACFNSVAEFRNEAIAWQKRREAAAAKPKTPAAP